jgi:O-antigen ligase
MLFALLLLEWLVLGVFSPVKDFGAEVRMMLIPLCAVWVGWRMSMDECRLKTLAVIFTVGVVMVGLSVVFMQGSGFSITEEYFADQKNSLGPMLATAAVLCMGLILGSKGRKNIPLIILGLVLVGLCVLLILTIRARAALLAVAVVLSLMLFQRFKSRYTLLSVWMAILLVVAVFILLPHSMKQYVNQSLFSGFSGGDITSGRMGRNYQAMGVWALNPLLGHLVNPTTVEVVHNYPLWSLYQYGLLGAFPFLAVYLYIFCVSLKRIWKIGVDTVMNTGCYMLMALFVVSLFEYTLPFGPGTSTVMSFVFLGMALKVPLKGESFIMEK